MGARAVRRTRSVPHARPVSVAGVVPWLMIRSIQELDAWT
jgi:hypothetical protein